MPKLTVLPHIESGGYHLDRFTVQDWPGFKPSKSVAYSFARLWIASGKSPHAMLRFEMQGRITMRGGASELARWTVEDLKRGGLRKVPWRETDWSFVRNPQPSGGVGS